MMWRNKIIHLISLFLVFNCAAARGARNCLIPAYCDGQPAWVTTYGSSAVDMLNVVLANRRNEEIQALTALVANLTKEIKSANETLQMKKKVSTTMAPTETTTASKTAATYFRFRSYNFPDEFIGLTSSREPYIRNVAEPFRLMTPGLKGISGTVSFESMRYPGMYLRERDSLLHLDTYNRSDDFLASATFWTRESKFYKNYTVYESFSSPKRFIRHQYGRLKIHPDDGTELFRNDTSFITEKSDICDMQYNNTCYWFAIHDKGDVNYTTSESICSKKNSTVADISDEGFYNYIVEKILSAMTGDSLEVWIGLRQDFNVSSFTLSNGQKAPFLIWADQEPHSNPGDTNVILHVVKDQSSKEQGMADHSPTYKTKGVICKY